MIRRLVDYLRADARRTAELRALPAAPVPIVHSVYAHDARTRELWTAVETRAASGAIAQG